MSMGKNIAYLRKSKGYTQEELGQKIGVTNQAVSKWESETSMPDIMLLPRIANALDVTLDDLICYSLVEVSRNCSVHVANCMNKDFVTCQNCKFKKSA